MRHYLMTEFGYFLAHSENLQNIVQIKFSDITDLNQLITVDLGESGDGIQFSWFIGNRPEPPAGVRIPHEGTFVATFHDHLVRLCNGRIFLTILPSGDVQACEDGTPGSTSFLPISAADYTVLATLTAERWIIMSQRKVLAAEDIGIVPGFKLKLGDLEVSLAQNLPFLASSFPFRLPLFIDGWKIEFLALYKPLIFCSVAKSENAFQQFYVNLESLAKLGNYDGDVLVLADRSHKRICQDLQAFDPRHLRVVPLAAADRVGCMAGRYCILEIEEAYRYQPILYMDLDVVYNADVQPMLLEIALSDHLMAPVERFSPLAETPSVGSQLLKRDNIVPGIQCGFNSGTLGIPNLPAHRKTLELIRRVIVAQAAEHGRDALPFVDQPAANYVAVKTGAFDIDLLERYVRFGSMETAERPGALTGAVHFFGIRNENKDKRPELMRKYMNLVLASKGLLPGGGQ